MHNLDASTAKDRDIYQQASDDFGKRLEYCPTQVLLVLRLVMQGNFEAAQRELQSLTLQAPR